QSLSEPLHLLQRFRVASHQLPARGSGSDSTPGGGGAGGLGGLGGLGRYLFSSGGLGGRSISGRSEVFVRTPQARAIGPPLKIIKTLDSSFKTFFTGECSRSLNINEKEVD